MPNNDYEERLKKLKKRRSGPDIPSFTDWAAERAKMEKMADSLESHKGPKVFLGGTVGGSKWRDELIPQLQIRYFNPVVDNWTETNRREEIRQRSVCDFVLYTLTKDTKGFYSIAEVVDDSNKQPKKTIFCVLKEGLAEHQLKSLKAVAEMVEENGGKVFWNLKDVANYVNGKD